MRIIPILALIAGLAPDLACVSESSFVCTSSEQCGEGRCEVTGYCSFADSSCESGQRYGDYAEPSLADVCVGLMAVRSGVASISPGDVAIGSKSNAFAYAIELSFQPGDSGVDRLEIHVPPGFGPPAVQSVLVGDEPVSFSDASTGHDIVVDLDEHIRQSASIVVRFAADGQDVEDPEGLAFPSHVSDTQSPAIPATQLEQRSPDGWLVTTSSWPAAAAVVAELSPNQALPSATTDFAYDLRIEIGERNTGVDALTLGLPSHLEFAGPASVSVNGAIVDLAEGSTSGDLVLSDKLVATSQVRIAFPAEVIACSNDQRGALDVTVDDLGSQYAPQSAQAGNANDDQDDDNSNELTSLGSPRLYWADRDTAKIQSGVDESCAVDDLVSGLTDPRLLAADLDAGKVYWADVDVGQLWRANLDGTGLEVIVTGLVSPSGVAIDVAAGKLYWTDYGSDRIQRSNFDGSAIETLVVRGPLPYGIALDLANQTMYWADTGEGVIVRAGLDGSNVEVVVTGLPEAADVVVAGSRIYASAHGAGKIVRANLDGSARMTVVNGQNEPVGLAYDSVEQRLYWADSGSGSIRSSDANGGDVQDMIIGLSDPQGLVLGR